MSTIINGTSSAITFPDSTVQNTAATNYSAGGTITGNLSVTGNLSFNSGYGSSAVGYGCRAWVNFNGTGTPAIRASGNVSSITDNGTLSYRINFATAMPDVSYNYVFGGTNVNDSTGSNYTGFYATTGGTATTSLSFVGLNIFNGGANQGADNPVINVSIFR